MPITYTNGIPNIPDNEIIISNKIWKKIQHNVPKPTNIKNLKNNKKHIKFKSNEHAKKAHLLHVTYVI